jgi:hypothetical protein
LFAIERRVEKVGKKERETGEGEWVRERREERSWKKLFLPEARSGSPPGATEQLFSGGTAR